MAHFAFSHKRKKSKQPEQAAETAAEQVEAEVSAPDASEEDTGPSSPPASGPGEDEKKDEKDKGSSSPLSRDNLSHGVDELSKRVRNTVDKINGESKASYSVWGRSSKRTVMYIIMIVILFGYVFFFTSPLWITEKTASHDPTPVGEAQTFGEDGNKSFTIDTWRYSPSQSLMEIKFNVSNEAYDGKDLYDFTVGYQGTKGEVSTEVEQMVRDPDFVVLIICNVPEKWAGICINVYYPGKTDGDPLLSFYANNDGMSKVQHIKILSSNGYRASVVDEQIDSLKAQKASLQKKIDTNNKKIANMDRSIQEINERMPLDTDDEKETDQENLGNIEMQQSTLKTNNEDLKSQIGAVDKDISQLQKKRDAFFGKSGADSGTKKKSKNAKTDSGAAVKVKKTASKKEVSETNSAKQKPKTTVKSSSTKKKSTAKGTSKKETKKAVKKPEKKKAAA